MVAASLFELAAVASRITWHPRPDVDRRESRQAQFRWPVLKTLLQAVQVAESRDKISARREPLPAFAEVTGEPGDHVVALKGFLVSRDIKLSYANAELGAAHGASLKGRILLRDDLSPAVEFSVLAHEIAHELLHTGERRAETSKTVRETSPFRTSCGLGSEVQPSSTLP